MATTIPAQVMQVDDHIGKIAKGFRDKLVAINLKNYSCKIVQEKISTSPRK